MRKIILVVALFSMSEFMSAQQVATANGNPNAMGSNNASFWSRYGNSGIGPNGMNNLFGTRWNSPIYTITGSVPFDTPKVRMVVQGDDLTPGTNPNNGQIGIGDNLPGNFDPQARFHMHQTTGQNTIRFTNNTTGTTNTNGMEMSLFTGTFPFTPFSRRFEFRSRENRLITFRMPNSGGFANALMVLHPTWGGGNGSVLIRPTGPVSANYQPAFLNIGGAIAFSEPGNAANINTLMYHNTSLQGVPTSDGFRMVYDFNAGAGGAISNDYLIFEKTDDGANNLVDGGFRFTNRGLDNISRLSMTIEGDGNVGIGLPFNFTVQPWRKLTVTDRTTQLRLSFASSTAIATDIYTDFFTDANGNLFIDPRNANDALAGVVNINYQTGLVQPYPNLSLDVNGQVNIRTVNQDDILDRVMVWEPVTGNVRWRDAATLVGGSSLILANNGTSLDPGNPNQVQLGQNLFAAGNPGELINNREIPMNEFNLVFTDNGSTTYGNNEIGIGTSSPQAKLHVNLNSSISSGGLTRSALFENHSISASGKGIKVNMSNHTTASYGVQADIDATTNTSSTNFGLRTRIDGGNVNYGSYSVVEGAATTNIAVLASATSNSLANTVIGVDVVGRGGRINHGVKVNAYGLTGTISNYGIQTNASGPSDYSYGIHARTSPLSGIIANYAGYFQGDVYITGNGFVNGGVMITSDRQFKKDVANIRNATEILDKLSPKTYLFKTKEFERMNFSDKLQYGLIAQEVEAILPGLVQKTVLPPKYDDNNNIVAKKIDYKALNYTGFIPVLIQGHKEQQEYVEGLEAEIEGLSTRIEKLEELLYTDDKTTSIENSQNITLENIETIILDQNVPNPFAESTMIKYVLPKSVIKARLHFYNQNGRIIKTVELIDRGEGSIKVYGEDLSSGVYTYSLVADGKVISAKKMVKTK